ncbi:MAG: hypothetical protein J1D99_02875 [Campylobacter sp.]|nr:hypothetical protein [Campylobacter sp.]
MKNKNHFIPFDELFYLQKEGEFQNDFLFEQSIIELGLSPMFEYQMSFFKEQNKYHIFLTHINNLNQKEFCYPQPLIFGTLFDEKLIKQRNFAVLVFDKKFAFLCFYQNAKLSNVRNLPQFSLKDIDERNKLNKEDFFSQMLFEQGRILQLFEYNKSEILITFCDEFNFGEFFKQKTLKNHIELESFFKENALQSLSELSHKHLNIDANFIKEEKKQIKTYISFIVVFFVFYLGTLVFLMVLDYPKFKQNENTKQSNENLKNELKTLNLKSKLLNEELEKLNASLNQNKILLEKNEELLQTLSYNFYPHKDRILILSQIIEILNQSSIKISVLNLENKEIKLVFNDKENLDKALNSFKNESLFKILKQDKNYLILGYENE